MQEDRQDSNKALESQPVHCALASEGSGIQRKVFMESEVVGS